MAAIADIIGREGFEFWDDESYAKCAHDLRQAATDVSAAVETDNFEQAQQAEQPHDEGLRRLPRRLSRS